MGNINNLWFLQGGGQSWADTKCQLDDCYSIPYLAGDDYWFQVDIPEGYSIDEWWLCANGDRVQELSQFDNWKIITQEDPYMQRLIFKMPAESYACIGLPCTRCTASMYQDGISPATDVWVDNYVAGTNNITVTLIDLVNSVNWDVTNLNAPLPAGFERIDLTTFYVPCDIDNTDWNIQFTTTGPFGNLTQTWPVDTTEVEVAGCGDPVDCWHIEIPLLVDAVEEATLQSEPHYCPVCTPTVELYGDYCLSAYDIEGELIFNTDGIGETQFGDLTTAQNNIRIQATLKQMPSVLEVTSNARCNVFGSKKEKRYKLQGVHYGNGGDYPDYMVNVIESIFAAKKIYIDGEQYLPISDQIFSERSFAGRSMKRLDVELKKCQKKVVFDCSCEVVPFDCSETEILYDGIMFASPAPDQGYGVDRSIWRVSVDAGAFSGGTAPYTLSGWSFSSGVPDNTFDAFDDTADHNFYRRGVGQYGPCIGCLNVTVTVTDANGCTRVIGNSVDMDDLRCVEQNGSVALISKTDTTITIGNVLPATGQPYAYSLDNISYSGTVGVTGGGNYTILGLAANTEYTIYIRVDCGGGQLGFIGPLIVTTDP